MSGNEPTTGSMLDPLHGQPEIVREVRNEHPVDRLMQKLRVDGLEISEIAKICEKPESTVRSVLSQPWAQMRMVRMIDKIRAEEVRKFVAEEVMPSLQVIKEIRDDKLAPPAVRKAAAESLVDRLLGKATQPFAQENIEPEKLSFRELASRVEDILGELPAPEDGQN